MGIKSDMWCRRCQQDVPALAGSDASAVACCARCGHPNVANVDSAAGFRNAEFVGDDASPAILPLSLAPSLSEGHLPASRPPWRIDDWRLESDLKQARRLVKRVQAIAGAPVEELADPIAEPIAGREVREARPRRVVRRRVRRAPSRDASSSPLAWILLGLGLTGLVCGASLLVWSYVTGRSELWNTGLPIALVSQAVMICGILLQPEAPVESRASDDDEEIVETFEEQPRRRAA